MSAGPVRKGHGLSPREQQVMDLYDGGRRPAAIARSLGLSIDHVRQIVRRYSWDALAAGMTAGEQRIRAATQELERRIRATGRLHS